MSSHTNWIFSWHCINEQVIGVAVVGTGFGQKVHIPGFQAHPRTQLVAVYHRELDKARVIANAYNIPHACNTIEDIVAFSGASCQHLDAAVALWYGLTVLQAGKHLLLENPQLFQQLRHRRYQLALANKVIATLDLNFALSPHSNWQNC